jgi:hypothetical protein
LFLLPFMNSVAGLAPVLSRVVLIHERPRLLGGSVSSPLWPRCVQQMKRAAWIGRSGPTFPWCMVACAWPYRLDHKVE